MSIEESQNVNDLLNRIKAAYQLHRRRGACKTAGQSSIYDHHLVPHVKIELLQAWLAILEEKEQH